MKRTYYPISNSGFKLNSADSELYKSQTKPPFMSNTYSVADLVMASLLGTVLRYSSINEYRCALLPTTFLENMSVHPPMGVGIEFARKNSKKERAATAAAKIAEGGREEGRSLTRLSGPFRIAFGRDTRERERERSVAREGTENRGRNLIIRGGDCGADSRK